MDLYHVFRLSTVMGLMCTALRIRFDVFSRALGGPSIDFAAPSRADGAWWVAPEKAVRQGGFDTSGYSCRCGAAAAGPTSARASSVWRIHPAAPLSRGSLTTLLPSRTPTAAISREDSTVTPTESIELI